MISVVTYNLSLDYWAIIQQNMHSKKQNKLHLDIFNGVLKQFLKSHRGSCARSTVESLPSKIQVLKTNSGKKQNSSTLSKTLRQLDMCLC